MLFGAGVLSVEDPILEPSSSITEEQAFKRGVYDENGPLSRVPVPNRDREYVCGDDGPVGKDGLLRILTQLGINIIIKPYSSSDHHLQPGLFCKNILLKDRKHQYFLVIVLEDKQLDLKYLKTKVNAHRNFSFASNSDLFDLLGVQPGCVTPFGLVNDKQKKVKVVLDKDINTELDYLNFHPLTCNETALVTYDQLITFLDFCGADVLELDL